MNRQLFVCISLIIVVIFSLYLALTVTWCVKEVELGFLIEGPMCGTGPGWCGYKRVRMAVLKDWVWTGPGEVDQHKI